jgi:shikimate dehydrogenase
MKQYGLLGYPLSHSFSRDYFTTKFQNEGIDAVYSLFPIPDIKEFPSLIESITDFGGMNVTIPYKQVVIPFLDELNNEARAIGAVNVIRKEINADGKLRLIGYNSDLFGFRESIRPLIRELRQRLKLSPCDKLEALVLGTGGASKAVLYALEQLGIPTQVVSRNQAPGQITYPQLSQEHYERYQIVVNTTPLGMSPKFNTCPELDYQQFGNGHLLYDLVYNPDQTLFLKNGEERGCLVKNGLEMLHLQADAAWEIWNRPD